MGILDIFGFENLPTNSFEQLCINTASEQINLLYNKIILNWDKQEYALEGIPYYDLPEKFGQNSENCLDLLLSKPLGIFSILDEEIKIPKADNKHFMEKLNSNFQDSKIYCQNDENDHKNLFEIKHFAGKIIYDCNGFIGIEICLKNIGAVYIQNNGYF